MLVCDHRFHAILFLCLMIVVIRWHEICGHREVSMLLKKKYIYIYIYIYIYMIILIYSSLLCTYIALLTFRLIFYDF